MSVSIFFITIQFARSMKASFLINQIPVSRFGMGCLSAQPAAFSLNPLLSTRNLNMSVYRARDSIQSGTISLENKLRMSCQGLGVVVKKCGVRLGAGVYGFSSILSTLPVPSASPSGKELERVFSFVLFVWQSPLLALRFQFSLLS